MAVVAAVESVRYFQQTNTELGVGYVAECSAWFVFDRYAGVGAEWVMHCGPYSLAEFARQWIADIRETAA